MAVAQFYKLGDKRFTLAYYNHGTPQADDMEACVKAFGRDSDIEFVCGNIKDFRAKSKDESPEEYWRVARYSWLNSLSPEGPIVVAQHLDDCIEGWIFSSLNGVGRVMSHKNGRIIRPFLTNRKSDLIAFAERHNLRWVEDKSNADETRPRNFIRHSLLPMALKVNPGLHKLLKKKVLAQFAADKTQ